MKSMMLNIISSNIRFSNPDDGINHWPNRKEILFSCLKSFSPHIVGTQEGRKDQLEEFQSGMGLKMIDTHRDWIIERMYPTLFVQEDLLVEASGDIWLSETPDVAGSKSFGSAFPRLCTWATFSMNGCKFLVANAHLDHEKVETRLKQAEVLSNELKKLQGELPLILLGDFNAIPKQEVHQFLIKDLELTDPWVEQGKIEQTSYHKFQGSFPEGKRIDWLLHSQELECNEIFLDETSSGDVYPSDHFPLKSKMNINS